MKKPMSSGLVEDDDPLSREVTGVAKTLDELRKSINYHMEQGVVYNLSGLNSSFSRVEEAIKKLGASLAIQVESVDSSLNRQRVLLAAILVVQTVALLIIAWRCG